MTTTTTTPAVRMLATLWVEPDRAAAALTDSKAAMLSWAGRDGRYTIEDVLAIVQGHGETLSAWVAACDQCDGCYAVYSAEAAMFAANKYPINTNITVVTQDNATRST